MKLVTALLTVDMPGIVFTGLIVIPDPRPPVSGIVVEAIPEPVRALQCRLRKLPQNHLPHGAIDVNESSTKNQRRGGRHMASETIEF